ncbi:winged helix-turn-helix domain-containing protein [Streptomyces pratensis]|uniref:winged helix-turn-helix domain-containing protein n=1 Tax=Streptomyces pratensis TaxID=1169025 RepID=UPI0019347052|nr:winged helix-turn-helix domain-containing protein [Streptomyces pratensis]
MAEGTAAASGTAPGGIRCELLRPLRALRDGVEVPLGPPKQRAVLAVLLPQEGRPISYDGLVEAVWGGAPPVHVRNLVQKYVSGLRRALGDRVQLVWTGSGYQLAGIHADDLRRRRRLVDEALAAREAGELRRAAELAEEAEELWRTPRPPERRELPVHDGADRRAVLRGREVHARAESGSPPRACRSRSGPSPTSTPTWSRVSRLTAPRSPAPRPATPTDRRPPPTGPPLASATSPGGPTPSPVPGWYQPGTGGFTSRDTWQLAPTPSAQANRYGYADGAPLDAADPTGHCPACGLAALGGTEALAALGRVAKSGRGGRG